MGLTLSKAQILVLLQQITTIKSMIEEREDSAILKQLIELFNLAQNTDKTQDCVNEQIAKIRKELTDKNLDSQIMDNIELFFELLLNFCFTQAEK